MNLSTNINGDGRQSGMPQAPPKRRWRIWLIALALVVIPLIVFQDVRVQGFVAYDDSDHVYANPYLNPVTAANVLHFWQTPYHHLYIPLSYTIYAGLAVLASHPFVKPPNSDIDSPLDPLVFHAASLLVHIVNILLVFMILRLLVRKNGAAALGALLFGIHPVQVESVCWISELRGLLSGLCTLIALWCALRGAMPVSSDLSDLSDRSDRSDRSGKSNQAANSEKLSLTKRRALAIAAPILMILAILCKPGAVVLPLMVLALDHWAIGRPWRKCLVSAAPLLAVSVVFAAVTQIVQPPVASVAYPLWERPFIAGDSLAFYLEKLVLPWNLAIIYGRTPEFVMRHWWAYATWLVPAFIGILFWMRRKSSPWLLAAGGVFLAYVLPVLGLVQFLFQHFSTTGDRYLYLALIGPAYGASRLLARHNSPALRLGFCLILGILGFLSMAQSRTWDNTEVLWRHEIAVDPSNKQITDKLAELLNGQGKTGEAIALYQTDLQYNPDDLDARFDLAIALLQSGKFTDAIPVFREFVRLVPDSEEAHYGLATALYQTGGYEDAIGEFREAIRLKPDSPSYHAALGSALAGVGRRGEAIPELRDAVRLQPDYPEVQSLLRRLGAAGGY